MKYNVFEPKEELPFVANFRNMLLKHSIFDDEARIAYDWLCVCIDNAPNGRMDYEIVCYADKIINFAEEKIKKWSRIASEWLIQRPL